MANNLVISLYRRTSGVIINHVQRRNMPVNVPPTAVGKRRFRLEVETDPHKLVNYCCGLNYTKDSPPVEIKPDSDYPEWLWQLRLGPKPNSWEMEKGTKEYYLRLAEENYSRNILLKQRAPKVKKVTGKHLLDIEEMIHRLRFAVLADHDAGVPMDSIAQDWHPMYMNTIKQRDFYLPLDENKVLYKDKIPGNIHLKNFHRDEDSTFKPRPKCIEPRPQIYAKPILDSRRRHPYTGN